MSLTQLDRSWHNRFSKCLGSQAFCMDCDHRSHLLTWQQDAAQECRRGLQTIVQQAEALTRRYSGVPSSNVLPRTPKNSIGWRHADAPRLPTTLCHVTKHRRPCCEHICLKDLEVCEFLQAGPVLDTRSRISPANLPPCLDVKGSSLEFAVPNLNPILEAEDCGSEARVSFSVLFSLWLFSSPCLPTTIHGHELAHSELYSAAHHQSC